MNFLSVTLVVFFILPNSTLGVRSKDVSTNRTIGLYSTDPVGLVPSYPKFTKLNSYYDHPCSRKCVKGDNRECYYTFIVDYYETLSEACGDCPNNFNDCYNKHCVPADGRKTKMMTINYMFPSPIIEVCLGDTIVVDVKNLLLEVTTIHWHGIHQRLTPWMDGVPYLTHYPIEPGETFRYRFLADNKGSLWYHSHFKFQRGFGLSGALIVREPTTPNQCTYDFDKHVVFINDWVYDFNTTRPTNILINNKGRFQGNNDTLIPFYSYFKVTQGFRYRFRMIFEAVFNCPVTVSVDDHEILAIASDGNDFKPIPVGSIVIMPGERWDFVLTANKTKDCYWMRFKGALNCNNLYQSAILQYNGANCVRPDEPLSFDYPLPGKQLNAVNAAPYSSDLTIAAVELKPLDKPEWSPKQKFVKYYFQINFAGIGPDGLPAFTINNIRSIPNTLSLYLVKDFINQDKYFCNETSLEEAGNDCEETLCQCIHRVNIPKDEYSEIIFTNNMGVPHPMHMHGYTYTLSTQGIFNSTEDIPRVQELDEAGLIPRKRTRGPLKDVAQLMANGWLGYRFKANNCGFWFTHCHIEGHADEGMHFTFKICEDEDILSYPKQLKCQ